MSGDDQPSGSSGNDGGRNGGRKDGGSGDGGDGNGGGGNGDGGNGGGGNGGGNGGGGNGDQGTEKSGPSTAEKVVMAISVTFTLALVAFVVFQAMTTPTGVPPQASVVGTQPMAGDSVEVAVRLNNPSDVGLQRVAVEVDCTSPPPEVQFQHVPADDYQVGYVVCPAGTSDPGANVSWWIEA